MSKIIKDETIPLPSTHDEAVEEFRYVHDLKSARVIEIEETRLGDSILVLLAGDSAERPYYAFVADRRDLLELAHHIQEVLDPSPQDQMLAELKAIRKLLEDQK